MIVVDNDVISYFWIQMDVDRSAHARQARKKDPDWIALRLWRSEFRNVLRDYLTYVEAIGFAKDAEADLSDQTYDVDSADVLRLVDAIGHSAYDPVGAVRVAVAEALFAVDRSLRAFAILEGHSLIPTITSSCGP